MERRVAETSEVERLRRPECGYVGLIVCWLSFFRPCFSFVAQLLPFRSCPFARLHTAVRGEDLDSVGHATRSFASTESREADGICSSMFQRNRRISWQPVTTRFCQRHLVGEAKPRLDTAPSPRSTSAAKSRLPQR